MELMAEEIPPLVKGQVRYRFTVSDTGIGIPAEFLAHIFEHFTRGRTSEHIEGTGLGLSITKGLVDLMGGKISVTSQERKGTTFEVELEYEPVPDGKESGLNQKSPTADTQCDQLFDGCHFLVAEDNAINAEILCELLKIYGAHYDVKADGKQAAQAFFDMPPGSYDAILMDIQMPEMNGLRGYSRYPGVGQGRRTNDTDYCDDGKCLCRGYTSLNRRWHGCACSKAD